MKIAFVAPLAESVPPERYGGTERVVHWLVEELVRRGHEITLFASEDSRTSATLVPCAPRCLRPAGILDHCPAHVMMLGEVFQRAREFDLIHCHVDVLAFPFCGFTRTPVVHTMHGRLDTPLMAEACRRFPAVRLISISDAQRTPVPAHLFEATVWHGMRADLYRYDPRGGDYVLFLGRFSREKGPLLAIEAARRAGIKLKMAAKVDPHDREFYEREVVPALEHADAEVLDEATDAEKQELLGGAKALLLPIDWPEPFGLTFIEALACGTPVITRPCGSVPEIVRPGVTGIVGSTLDDMVRALRDVERIDRAACRADFEAHFTVGRMTDEYERVYHRVLARSQTLPDPEVPRARRPA